MTNRIDDILSFWFGAQSDPDHGRFRPEWFAVDPAFDEAIRQRFLTTHEQACRGELDYWGDDPRGALALIIVLDQFSRNLFRGSPRTYDMDARARALAVQSLDRGFDRQLPASQCWFLYMPFMHSEDLADQDRSVALFQAMGQQTANNLEYALDHRETIARFGRFPHRNEVLGRTSTAEEEAFLAARAESPP